DNAPTKGNCKIAIGLVGSEKCGSVVKVRVNNVEKRFEIEGYNEDALTGKASAEGCKTLTMTFDAKCLKRGGNEVNIMVLEGGWVVFDHITFEGPDKLQLMAIDAPVFVRNVAAADYELASGDARVQPLLVDVEHLQGNPKLTVMLDDKKIFESAVDTARYVFEAPMPAVAKRCRSKYKVFAGGKMLQQGTVERAPQRLQTLADYVDTRIGTAHSRWMIAPGPWMPFSMVKLSPDNQNMGWQAGYQPTFETIGCFSHIHEWTMGGLGMMPTNGELKVKVGDQFRPDEGYRSRIDKASEEAPLGYYKVRLTDTDILVEATATDRASFQRYTFPSDRDGRVMVDLHIQAEYDYQLREVEVKQTGESRLEGYSHQISPRPHVWSNDADQEYTIHFVMEFDAPIKNIGYWKNDAVSAGNVLRGSNLTDAGMYVEFDTSKQRVVQARTAISLVSVANAAENLKREISDSFGWNFDAVMAHHKDVWNELFNRIVISTDNRIEKVRFYTNMYRAFARNTWSDVNGEWMTADEKVSRFDDPNRRALGCDAFWNTFWNLNQLWNLVAPEWSSNWVHSQLAMYDANGWLAKGPAGMEYIPVMVAEHEIPLIVSAYQMGIRDFDAQKALQAMVKMQTTQATHVAGGFAGNRDLESYMKHHYVPYDKGRYSNSLEYSFDDWTVGQMAKALGNYPLYATFNDRGYWWRNAFNPENGYAQMRDSLGNFAADFDPFRSGSNHHYVEGNAWQLSYFVPQDVPALIDIMGKEAFASRLDWGFNASEPWRYNAPNDLYWDYPVVQGNQQSMHFAFLFNWAEKPWLTQKWSRSIIERYYGSGVANAYLGDEDQGQMSAWFVMAALGLFQTDGGCRVDPQYEIASPLFSKVVIDLGNRYGRGKAFVIEARNASRTNKYVQSAVLNGKPLRSFRFSASELLSGGSLVLEMGSEPNKDWGVER
ncbi:MAG: GH92 family glycosyl hydrolase, partial [Muribaculaceae bacterium]